LPIADAVAILHQAMCGQRGADVDGPCHHPARRSRNVVLFAAPYEIDPTMRYKREAER
jgi:hypothetical protein